MIFIDDSNLFIFFILIFSINCVSKQQEKQSDVYASAVNENIQSSPDTLLKSESENANRKPIQTGDFKGRWILTDFFNAVKEKREFWTIVDDYPASSFAEIEIKDSTLHFKGWYEGTEIAFEWVGKTKIKTLTTPSQYWIIEFDRTNRNISCQYFNRDEPVWKHTYEKMPENSSFDITKLEKMIKENCLLGQYVDIESKKTVEITSNSLGEVPYQVVTDYEHLCTDLNLLKLESDPAVTACWSWSSDTLAVFKTTRSTEVGGCLTVKRGEVVKKLLLTKID